MTRLFEHVAVIAPGSYGLLHVCDDEQPNHEKEVYVLRHSPAKWYVLTCSSGSPTP
ncbi:Imm7 family immunity protein [Streptomyces rimosus]|uniref:Imm7 family immunity protein n=1 Tax=Streptomyces rimosus TaxID=1927 RepID=UPI0022770D6B|nr:Imm7 family immunity protein [Streptomyces rimosus]